MMPNPCCVPSRTRLAQLETSRRDSASREKVTAGSLDGMVHLEGGLFLMGTETRAGFPADGEGPVRPVHVDPFHVDRTAVTVQQFAEFVKSAQYRTEAVQFGWSFVFQAEAASDLVAAAPWWGKVEGAAWNHPEGPDSSAHPEYPVTHVTWNDAQAFCRWAGKRLPTEAEWEFAARGALEQKLYPWGDELTPDGQHRCNIWQGEFPVRNTGEDGYISTAPADAFEANGFELRNITGNTWEWCSDWFDPAWHITATRTNPAGPPTGFARVMKGGSYLCHASYCNRYRVAARTSNTPDSSTGNIGFRCVRDV
ncbi:MAG: formylglycine-generating enzyme family protein [Acidobacteriota bacterium]|nr:formylglycine-generating enzyme family protein [Acidobacteriota bacterium]